MTATMPERADLLPDGVTPLMMEAGALAEPGVIDRGSVPCAVCTMPAAIHPSAGPLVLLDPGHDHQVPEAYALALAALEAEDRDFMLDVAEGLAAEYVPSGSLSPRPSDAGSCPRQVWYRTRPPAGYQPRTDIDTRRAALGSIIHRAGETYRPGRYPWRRFEMPLRVPGLDGTYRVDEYDPVTGTVYDTKSAGRAKWLILADGPVDSMWEQLRIYAWALYLAGYPVRRLCIIAINRDTGEEERHWEEFDPAVAVAALDKLTALATALDAGVVPERAGLGPRDWRCDWCPAMRHCWNVDAAAAAGRGPVSYTRLGETPDTPAIVWAGLEALRVGKQVGDLKARHEFLKDLLQGLPSGVHGGDREDGGVEIVDSNSTSVAYKEAYETLLDLWDLPVGQRPTRGELPGPAVRKTVTQTARKPRVAKASAGRRKKKPSPAEQAAAAAIAAAGGEDTPAIP